MSAVLMPPVSALIPVDSPWRLALRRPVFGSLLLAAAFLFYTAPVKETPFLFGHAPWTNDPFDTVISFMMFFVPLIAVLCVPRVLLCQRCELLLATRIRDLLRGCRVIVAGVSLTLAAEWVSVLIGDNRGEWNAATWLQIGLLAAMTLASLGMIRQLLRLGLPGSPAETGATSTDWLGDSVLLARKQSRLLGPAGRPLISLLDWAERRPAGAVRRHPVWAAFGACAVFGIGIGVNQGIREGYYASVTVVAVLMLGAGMFGLLTASGGYLGLIRSDSRLRGTRRRLLDAVVITCIGILVPFAMRNHLWSLVGSNTAAAGLTQLLELLGIFAAAIFAAAAAAESVLRLHTACS